MRVCRPSPKDIEKIPYVFGDNYLHVYVREPSADLGIAEYPPRSVSQWNWWHDEVQYALEGECDFIYSLPPFHIKKEMVTLTAGDFYLIHKGTYGVYRNKKDKPYRVLFTVMPAPKEYLTGKPGA
jgi:quercetin dioxygenase-like cupin family protein